MKISKNQLRQIIKEELDAASAHTIATGGETIENPKMPTGHGHYAGKGRYEDWNTAGSGDRSREEDLESIRLAGDIGEKPEAQQRWDISDETGVPVLRDELDDALTSLSKDQVEQIIKEELAGALREGYASDFEDGVRNFGAGVGAATEYVSNLPSKFLSGFDSQTDLRVSADDRKKAPIDPLQHVRDDATEWVKTARLGDGDPRWEDPIYVGVYDNMLAGLDSEGNELSIERPTKRHINIDPSIEMDGRAIAAQTADHPLR